MLRMSLDSVKGDTITLPKEQMRSFVAMAELMQTACDSNANALRAMTELIVMAAREEVDSREAMKVIVNASHIYKQFCDAWLRGEEPPVPDMSDLWKSVGVDWPKPS